MVVHVFQPWKQFINLSHTNCLSELWKMHCVVFVERILEDLQYLSRHSLNTLKHIQIHKLVFVFLQISMSARSIMEAANTDVWTPEAPTFVSATQATIYMSTAELVLVSDAWVSQGASITADRLETDLGLNFWTLSPQSKAWLLSKPI